MQKGSGAYVPFARIALATIPPVRDVTPVRHVTGRPAYGTSECDGGYLPDAAGTCDPRHEACTGV